MMNVLHWSMSLTEQYNTSKNKSISWPKKKKCFWILLSVSLLFRHIDMKILPWLEKNDLDLSQKRKFKKLAHHQSQSSCCQRHEKGIQMSSSIDTADLLDGLLTLNVEKIIFKPNNNKIKQFVSQKLSNYSTAHSSLIHISLHDPCPDIFILTTSAKALQIC